MLFPIAPPDAILGLSEAFAGDKNPRKVNLSVGVYKDATGKTPIMQCVKEAEDRILRNETTKNYAPIEGSPEFARCVQELVFGPGSPALTDGRTVTAQTPGGTAALRVAADFLRKMFPNADGLAERADLAESSIDFSGGRSGRADLSVLRRARQTGLAFERCCRRWRISRPATCSLLHGCCHNPTGIDPTAEQWSRIAEIVAQR